MYLTQINKLRKIDKETFEILVSLCHLSKNLYNTGVYSIRQYYFNNGKYLNYFENYHICKTNDNYKLLGASGQSTLRHVDYSFRSFFKLIEKRSKGINLGKINIPNYLKKDSFYPITWTSNYFKVIANQIRLSLSKEFKKQFKTLKEFLFFNIPKNINSRKIKEVKIIPYQNSLFFKIHFTYIKEEEKHENLNINNFLSIDLGVNNFATCIDLAGTSFILDGRKLKSINQKYNKNIAKYKSILNHQNKKSIHYSKRLYRITEKRNNRVNEYINQSINYLIKFCIANSIGNIIIGDFRNIQNKSNLGKVNNQNFVQIPFGKFKTKLENKCQLHGINFICQEESYTSLCSFLDNEEVKKHNTYQGKRVSRGLFQTNSEVLINADVNAACNILKKYLSKQNLKNTIFKKLCSGLVNSPVRIRI